MIEGWDDPHIGSVVRRFDKIFGMPNPQIRTIFPSGDGKLPAHCPPGMVRLSYYGSCASWKYELTVDVEAVHLIAPYAKILISVTPADSEITDDAASQVAPPEMMEALEYISRKHLANVISLSDDTGESTYRYGHEEITAQDPGELSAAAAGIPVAVATGDCGAAQHLAVGWDDITKTRSTAAWDDSPWVTAVGGSIPNLSSLGKRLGPDPVWNNFVGSSGGGYSAVYARPAYQNRVRSITRSAMRSVPDITMDARSGTSGATPLFAGVLALATQLNHGKNIGPINKVLYDVLGRRGAKDGIADVVKGNNSVFSAYNPRKVIVRGFTAHKGFDVVSGWGTVNASKFVPSLVAATRAQHQDRSVRRLAAYDLKRLERTIRLSSSDIGAGGTALMSDGGFLPRHPVVLYIGNHKVATLTASTHGSVSYVIDPSALGLSPGRHALKLTSMLLTARRTFRSS